MSATANKPDVVLCSQFDGQVKDIIAGTVPLPNMSAIEGDVGAKILHYREMLCGKALLPNGASKWPARFFLDYGQGGQAYGSGIAVWAEWKYGACRAVGSKFAICDHKPIEGAGANHSRGWHPARCSKCGLDMSVDSGD